MYQRSTSPVSFARKHDISRLLDPAYASPPSAFASTSAYVDRHGELHDPDYRHFPVSQPKARRTSHSTVASRPKWETFDEDGEDEDEEEMYARTNFSSYQHKHQRPYTSHTSPSYPSYTPPSYTLPHSYNSADTEVDDDEDYEDAPSGVARILSRTMATTTTKFRKRRSLDSSSPSASPYSAPSMLSDAASEHHHPLALTPSHVSAQSEPAYHSTYTSLYPSPTLPTSRRYSSSHRSHTPTPLTPTYTPSHEVQEREEQWTPTCAQALRRQWQAVSLRVRFGLFRARRRMRSRIAGL
ncbi:hypothetical protein DXG01_011241 [Tephrocybe rancida]|nr:hypothetical protein DXG01_011241 [Tephrocybe rancida]